MKSTKKSYQKTKKSKPTNKHKKPSNKKYKPTNDLKYNKTFILSMRDDGVEYNTDIFRNLIKKLGLSETKNPFQPTSYLHLQHMNYMKYEKEFYNTPTLLMNILGGAKEVITNKSNLYFNFKSKFPEKCFKYMARTWDARKFPNNKFNDNDVFIVRPVGIGAFAGCGVEVVKNKKELIIVLNKLKKFPKIIISEYISDPMLLDSKKFHIRSYLLVKIINGVMSSYFYDFYEIFSADKPYIKGDWKNTDIHDTHLKSAGEYIVGPKDFNKSTQELFNKKIFPQMLDCMKYISKLIDGYAEPFENAKNAYEVFGCDFMVDVKFNVKLLEVNKHTGISMSDFPDRRDEFCKLYFGKIYDLVLEPFFNPKSEKIKPLYTS